MIFTNPRNLKGIKTRFGLVGLAFKNKNLTVDRKKNYFHNPMLICKLHQ